MNSKSIVGILVALIVLLGGAALWLVSQEETTPTRGDKPEDAVATGTAPAAEDPAKKPVKAQRSTWTRIGPGTVVGIVREYGTDRPLEGVELSLEAGLPGPNELLKTRSDASGGFRFEKVTNFDSWTLRAKAPPPLADGELAGVAVVENQVTGVGTLYLAPAFEVPGVVVDEKDAPVPGALVRAVRLRKVAAAIDLLRIIRELPARPPAVDTATTDAQGRFAMRKLPPGTYDFTVEKQGFQVKVTNGVVITPDAKSRPLRFVLVPGFAVDGIVVRDGGGPVEGLQVVAFQQPKDVTDFNVLDKSFATTDAKGQFRVEGLGGGRYIVAVTPEGEPATANADVPVPSRERVEIRLKGDCWLEGQVTAEDGKPVADAQVYTASLNQTPTVSNVRTDADGRYVMRGLSSGPVQLFLVQAEGFGTWPADVSGLLRGRGSDLRLVPGRNEKNVSLAKGATLRGVVKEKETGTPIAGARVDVTTPVAFFGGGRGATTAADGTFEVTDLAKGTAVVLVSKDGWFQPGVNAQTLAITLMGSMGANKSAQKDSGKGASIVVTDAGEVIERTIELSRGSSIAGVVLDPDGAVRAGAQVSLAPETGGNDMMGFVTSLFPKPEPRLTDAEGRYEIPGPPPGQKARVVARASGFLDGKSEPMACAPGDAKSGVDVKLRVGATLTGRVHDGQNRPVAGALVRWIPAPNEDWSLRWRMRNASPSITDAKGEFRITNVETGKLAVEVSEPRHLPWTKTDLVAEDGKPSELDVLLELGAVLEGKVLGPDGRPRAGARVSYDRQDEDQGGVVMRMSGDGSVTTDAAGAFRAEGLAPGRYEVQAQLEGTAPSEPLVVEPGGAPVTLQLAPSFSITGTVRMRSGGGVGDLEVALMRRAEPKPGALAVAAAGEAPAAPPMVEVQSTRTGPAGEFELKDVPAGTYDLQVSVEGWRPPPKPNVLPTTLKDVAAGRQGVIVECEPGLVISGTIYGEDGQPVLGGWVWGHMEGRAGTNVNAGVDEAGRFEVVGLQPGKYRLTFNGEGAGQKVMVLEAGAKDVAVKFGGGGTIKVRVVKEDGTVAQGAWVSVQGDAGGGNASVDDQGRAEVKSLGEGTYQVSAWIQAEGGAFAAHQEAVQVRAGVATEVELRLVKRQ